MRTLLRSGADADAPAARRENTTIGVVATNARLTKTQATRVALMADDGYARAIYPVAHLGDGDTVFALATGTLGRRRGRQRCRRAGRRRHGARDRPRRPTQATGAAGITRRSRDLQRER